MNLHDFDIYRRGKQEGEAEAEQRVRCETAKNLLSMGLSVEQVAQGSCLPVEEVQKLAEEVACERE